MAGEGVEMILGVKRDPLFGPVVRFGVGGVASELLGDLLLALDRPGEALVAYQRSLSLYPRRLNSLLGAARAARASGNESLARTMYQELLTLAGGGGRRAALEEARAFIASLRRE